MELNRILFIIGLAALISAGTIVFLERSVQESVLPSQTMPEPIPTPPPQEVVSQPQLHVVEVVANSRGFSPNNVSVEQGDILTLVIRSNDGRAHGFALDAFAIMEEINPRERVEISIPTQFPGTFTAYSFIPSHGNAGNMRFTVTVRENS